MNNAPRGRVHRWALYISQFDVTIRTGCSGLTQMLSMPRVMLTQWQCPQRTSRQPPSLVQCSPLCAEGWTVAMSTDLFRQHWVAVFQCPHAVLTDRGGDLLAEFRTYVRQELCSHNVIKSAYYPQGNAVNDKSLTATTATFRDQWDLSFRHAPFSTVSVRNATPHISTGESPHAAVFGVEPVLLGWQSFQRGTELVQRPNRVIDIDHSLITHHRRADVAGALTEEGRRRCRSLYCLSDQRL